MADIEEFEAWVKSKGGQKALAASIRKKFGEEIQISQTAISNWISRREVPTGKRAALKWAGWNGPYEWQEEAQEAPEPSAAALTRDDFLKAIGALETRLKDLESVIEDFGEGLRAAIPSMPPRSRPEARPR